MPEKGAYALNIIISPAKKMKMDPDSLPVAGTPIFLEKTQVLFDILKNMSDADLKKLWKCNDQIAKLNIHRLKNLDLTASLTPSILAYEGIQYRYMAPNVFTDCEFGYIQEHFRILSGFYGILKPFDGVIPYRLEMQAKLKVDSSKNLYEFWGSSIAESVFSESDIILNLASKEYSKCISDYLPKDVRFITCVFGEEVDGKIIEKGTMCKMARGEMVRYLAENKVESPDQISNFDRLGYCYSPSHSSANSYVFLR